MNRISCPVHSENSREWEVTPEGRVWACCNFSNAWDKRARPGDSEHQLLKQDPVLWPLMQSDNTWNSLEHHTLDEIVNHPIHQQYISPEGFKTNPSPVCVKNCSIIQDNIQNRTRSKSDLSLK